MDTVISPAMTYRAETWAPTKHQEKNRAVAPTQHGEIIVKYHEERLDSE